MAKIFISYSRVDREFVVALAKLLREVYGYDNVWYDENLHGGDIWWKEILDAIAKCEIFIYLLSNESVTSPYCLAEFQEAQRLYRGIITVQVRDRTNISGKLSDIHYIDMKKGVNDTFAYNQLIRAIAKQEKQFKPRRPSRRKRTPHPRIDITEPDEAPQRAEIITPDLIVMDHDTVIPHQKKVYSRPILFALLVFVGLLLGIGWFNSNYQIIEDTTATNTPSQALTPTLSYEEVGLKPVENNDAWTPVEQEFDGILMVLVPVGCFMMGGTGVNNEQPIHEQCFDAPFWIDKYEVTQGNFTRLGGIQTHASTYRGVNRPVDNIMWNEARDFCELRGGSLPTEAQWEYAGRGVDNLMFPWGNDFMGNYVVHKNNSGDRTADVGTYPDGASWVGALDMSGNVWEWVMSEQRAYPYQDDDGRNNRDRLGGRVLRGGSWNNTMTNLRTTKRFWNYASNWNSSFGFRCVINK